MSDVGTVKLQVVPNQAEDSQPSLQHHHDDDDETSSCVNKDKKRPRTEATSITPTQRRLSSASASSSVAHADAVTQGNAGVLELVADRIGSVQAAVVESQKSQTNYFRDATIKASSNFVTAAKCSATQAMLLIQKQALLQRAWAEGDASKAQLGVQGELLINGLQSVAASTTHSVTSSSLIHASTAQTCAKANVLEAHNARLVDIVKHVQCAADENEAKQSAALITLAQQCGDTTKRTARLEVALKCSNEAAVGHEDEILKLITVLQRLSERKHQREGSAVDLDRARAHVKLLEKQLSLQGIVEAVIPPDFLTAEQRARPPAPHPSVRLVAPNLFALRLLEHKDVSISELVDEWQHQYVTISSLKSQLQERNDEYQKLHTDAQKMHMLYQEEQRRRMAEERRVDELHRMRVSSTSGQEDLEFLRVQVTTTQDTNAMLSVQLKQSRDEVHRLDNKLSTAEATIATLRRELDFDQVGQSVAALKLHYEREAARLRNCYAHAEHRASEATEQLHVLQEKLQKSEAMAVRQRQAYDSMVHALKASEKKGSELQTQLSSARKEIAESQRKFAEELRAAAATTTTTSSSRGSVMSSQLKHPKSAFTPTMNVVESLERMATLAATFYDTAMRTISSGTAEGHRRQHQEDAADSAPMTLLVSQQASVIEELRLALRAALTFSVVQLETTETTRSYLIDAQLSDSEALHALYEKLSAVTADRDSIKVQLDECQAFIEKHGLRAVEDVLMHEVSSSHSDNGSQKASSSTSFRRELVEEELLTLRAKCEEHVLKSEQLTTLLSQAERTIQEHSLELLRARALADAAKREAQSWRSLFSKEQSDVRALIAALSHARREFESLILSNASKVSVCGTKAPEREPEAEAEEEIDQNIAPHSFKKPEKEEIEREGDEANEEGRVVHEAAPAAEVETQQQESVDDQSAHSLIAEASTRDGEELQGRMVVAAESSEGKEEEEATDCIRLPNPQSSIVELQRLLQTIATGMSRIVASEDDKDNENSSGGSNEEDGSGSSRLDVETLSREAERSMEAAAKEKLKQDGIGAVVHVLREIYEATGLMQRRRRELAAKDAVDDQNSSNMLVDTLQRKCVALEELRHVREDELAQRDALLMQEKKKLEESSRHSAQLTQELDAVKQATRDKDSLCTQLQEEVQRCKAELQRNQQEILRQTENNTKLLTMVKTLHAARTGSGVPPPPSPQSQPITTQPQPVAQASQSIAVPQLPTQPQEQ